MHAVFVTAEIAAGQFEHARKGLHDEVMPRVSKAPGLVKAFWTVRADQTQGLSCLVFDTKQNAEGAVSMIRSSPPPPGVTIGNVEIREVVAQA
jgi:hypothetical protein